MDSRADSIVNTTSPALDNDTKVSGEEEQNGALNKTKKKREPVWQRLNSQPIRN